MIYLNNFKQQPLERHICCIGVRPCPLLALLYWEIFFFHGLGLMSLLSSTDAGHEPAEAVSWSQMAIESER